MMRKSNAIQLLDITFNNKFDIVNFSQFIKELFNEIDINVIDKTQYIDTQYKNHISQLKKIGKYKDEKRQSIEILTVKLERSTSRDRARTMQRNFIAGWLSKWDVNAALVAFYGDDPDDWRFSFVRMDYSFAIDEKTGRQKVAKELTPARRYSYLVGVNEPNHTCQRQFLELVMGEKTNPSIGEIEQAFSVEKVTKEFFEKYKELALNLKDAMDDLISRDPRIKTEFESKGITSIDFSKKLLGQIVFIYFLQKKGWLGVKKKEDGTFDEWGAGPKRFLRKLFEGEIVLYDNFFNDMLEPLFYEALAEDRSVNNDYYSRFKCKIPFLNGGLFEPLNEYNWTGTDIIIPNEFFSNNIRTKEGDLGTGILDVFDRFNFTVKEDEPLEREVAVDPEMLGKVFENLLEVKERKDKGAFYTPREIVHYMCQQSLINYLETNTDISRDEIEKFIQYGDLALDQTIRAMEQKEKWFGKTDVDDEFLIPPSIQDNYQTIDQLLRDIKIVDPAVGSGAFPIGMMNEIVKVRSILTIYFSTEEQEERTEYNFKRETIENSLYGVDIDPSAVEIAKLRFWLSLIVDEEKKENIQPLPNLDHKIMCGNSLLEEFEGVKLFDERLLGEAKVKNPIEVEIDGLDEHISRLNVELKDIKFGDRRPMIRKKIDELDFLKQKKSKLEKKLVREKRSQQKDTQVTIDDALQHRIKESQIKLSKLKKLQKEFFNEQDRNRKKQLREEIDKIEWELIETTLEEQGHEEAMQKLEGYRRTKVKPFFLWKLYFAEVFQRENPGFDLVIANPPYVDSENMVKNTPQEREDIASSYETAKGNWDLYIPFFELGFKVSRKNGDLSYIAPNKWLSIGYGKALRKYFLDYVKQLCNCDDVEVFEAGNTPEIVFVKKILSEIPIIIHSFTDNYILLDKGAVQREIFGLGNWGMVLSEHLDILLNILDNNKYINGYCDVENPFTVSEAYEIKQFVYEGIGDNQNEDLKLIVTGTIDKYISLWGKKKTSYIKDIYDFPIVDRKKFQILLPKRYVQSISAKIIITGIRYFECFFDMSGNYVAGKSTIIIRNPKENITYEALLAILNSNLVSFYIREAYSATGIKGGVNFTAPMIKALPMTSLTNKDIYALDTYSKEIIKISDGKYYLDNPDKQEKIMKLEQEIDKLIYNLYELSPEQIKIIEDNRTIYNK